MSFQLNISNASVLNISNRLVDSLALVSKNLIEFLSANYLFIFIRTQYQNIINLKIKFVYTLLACS